MEQAITTNHATDGSAAHDAATPAASDYPPTIAGFRQHLGLSQESFARLVGLASKGNVSIIERDNRCSLSVALKIEQLSAGYVDAAELCADVASARAGCVCHDPTIATEAAAASPDNGDANIGRAA